MKPFKVIGYDTGKVHTTEIVKAILEPLGGELLPVKQFDKLPDADLVVISGILRGTGLVFKQCVADKRDFLFVDHAYFQKGYDHPNWMRISRNRHSFGPSLINSSSKRFNTFFSRKMSPWRGGTVKHILLMPPTHAISWLFDAHDWEEKTVARLKSITNRPIEVRGKPNNPIVDELGNLLYLDNSQAGGPSLAEDLADAYAAVIYNSNAAIECLQAGVPVICEDACAATAISFKYEDIDTPIIAFEPRRQQLFYDLANSQFTREEMRTGKLPEALLGRL